MVLKQINFRVLPYLHGKCTLNLLSGIVFVVQDPVLGMSSFTCQVIFTPGILIKLRSPLNQFTNLGGTLPDHHFNHLLITEMISGHQGILHMFIMAVGLSGYSRNPSLRITGIGLVHFRF